MNIILFTHKKSTGGYVALLSTMIIGAMLLIMTMEAGQLGWHTRYLVLGTEAKEQSRTIAENCTNQAVAHLITDVNWTGSATNTYKFGTCYVWPLQKNYPVREQLTIKVQTVVWGRVTNLVSVYDMGDINQTAEVTHQPPQPIIDPLRLMPQIISVTEFAVMP